MKNLESSKTKTKYYFFNNHAASPSRHPLICMIKFFKPAKTARAKKSKRSQKEGKKPKAKEKQMVMKLPNVCLLRVYKKKKFQKK